jgi:hypothetical protein
MLQKLIYPLNQLGKVIVPIEPHQDSQLVELKPRTDFSGVDAKIISQYELNELEPYGPNATGRSDL